jgi:hypothetical protein
MIMRMSITIMITRITLVVMSILSRKKVNTCTLTKSSHMTIKVMKRSIRIKIISMNISIQIKVMIISMIISMGNAIIIIMRKKRLKRW